MAPLPLGEAVGDAPPPEAEGEAPPVAVKEALEGISLGNLEVGARKRPGLV